MLLLISSWLLFFAVCLGLNYSCERLLLFKGNQDGPLIERLLLGACLTALFSIAFSIFTPLKSSSVKLFLIGCALLGLLSLIVEVRKRGFLNIAIYFVVLVSICLYAAWPLSSIKSCEAYDSLLYHLPQVQWMREHGTPLGLGNLHSRLGTPTTFLSTAAMFEQWSLEFRSAWFMAGIFPLLGFIWCFNTARRSYIGHDKLTLIYACVLFIPLSYKLSCLEPGLYFDDVAGILQVIIVGECLRLRNLTNKDLSEISNIQGLIIALSALSITTKISSLMVAVVALTCCLLARPNMRQLKGSILVASLLLIGYGIRASMLTGWAFYPIPFGQLPVSWAIPAGIKYQANLQSYTPTTETVNGNIEVISAWAKLPGPSFFRAIQDGTPAWWPQWWSRFSTSRHWRLICFALLALMLRFDLKNTKRSLTQDLIFVSAFGLAPILYWAYSAPDPRFALFNFWILAAIAWSIVLSESKIQRPVIITLSLIYFVFEHSDVVPRRGRPNWVTTGMAAKRPAHEIRLRSGASVFIPYDSGDDRCGQTDLPCTPYIKQDLQIEQRGGRFLRFWLEASE